VDLYNEPNLSDPQLMTALHEEAAYVREVAPRVPITIGGWKNEIPDHSGKFDWQDPVDIPKFIKMVDIVSPHLYEFEQGARQGLSPPTRCATRSTLVKQATSGTKTVRTSVYFCVGMLVFQTRPVKGAESYVAEIRDLIILAMFVLPQAEGPGRAVAGRTSRCLHLQHLCRLLSTGHAERAREAASSPSLLNVA